MSLKASSLSGTLMLRVLVSESPGCSQAEWSLWVKRMGCQVILVLSIEQLGSIPGKPAVYLLFPIVDFPLFPDHRNLVSFYLQNSPRRLACLREWRTSSVLAGPVRLPCESGILVQELTWMDKKRIRSKSSTGHTMQKNIEFQFRSPVMSKCTHDTQRKGEFMMSVTAFLGTLCQKALTPSPA